MVAVPDKSVDLKQGKLGQWMWLGSIFELILLTHGYFILHVWNGVFIPRLWTYYSSYFRLVELLATPPFVFVSLLGYLMVGSGFSLSVFFIWGCARVLHFQRYRTLFWVLQVAIWLNMGSTLVHRWLLEVAFPLAFVGGPYAHLVPFYIMSTAFSQIIYAVIFVILGQALLLIHQKRPKPSREMALVQCAGILLIVTGMVAVVSLPFLWIAFVSLLNLIFSAITSIIAIVAILQLLRL